MRLKSSHLVQCSAYERVANKLLRNQPKAKPYCRFRNGWLMVGTQSLHRTPAARMWRTFWRIKQSESK